MLVQLGLLHVCGHNTVAREAQQRLCFYSLRWPLDHVNAAWGTWGKHVRFSKQTVKLKLHDELKLMLVYQIKTVMINKKKISNMYTLLAHAGAWDPSPLLRDGQYGQAASKVAHPCLAFICI